MVVTKATTPSAATEGQLRRRPSEALLCAWLLAVLAAGAEGETWSLQPGHPLHCSAGGTGLSTAAAPFSQENPGGGTQWGWGLNGGG